MPAQDARYERHVRPLPQLVRRAWQEWDWQDPDGHRWAINVEHVGDADAPVRMVLVHGPRGSVRYPLWQQVLLDLVAREKDERPLVLVGASMGGMLALDTAARSGLANRVIVTCLLDVTRPEVRAGIVRWPWLATLGLPLLRLARGPLARLPVPGRWLTPMARISNAPALAREVLRDPRGGGSSLPLGWYRSFLATGPAVAPERVSRPPVILLHPGEDRWTAPQISEDFLARLAGPTRTVRLTGARHFPVEEPGFQQLLDEVAAEISTLTDEH